MLVVQISNVRSMVTLAVISTYPLVGLGGG